MAGVLKTNLIWNLISIPVGLVSLFMYLFKGKPKLDIRDKVVFITGASSGLGKACAAAFFDAGCKVILSGRNKDTLEAVKNELMADKAKSTCPEPAIVVIDLQDIESIPGKITEALSCFGGRIDILINNAGVSYRGLAADTDLQLYQNIMNINFFAQVMVTKAILPQMIQRKSGHIVAISSVQGLIAIPSRSAYTASKHAFEGYCGSLRAELSEFNIDVCVVNPYYIKTNLSLNAICSDGSKHGELDRNTAVGLEPSYVAGQVLDCVISRSENKLLCPMHVRLAICLRAMIPFLFFKLMERRHKKEQMGIKKKS